MSDAQNMDDVQSPEAIKAEETVLKEVPQSELRSQIIEKYGLDEEVNSDLIDTLVKDKVEENKKLQTAIRQKISWREQATKPVKAEEVKLAPAPSNAVNYVTKEDLEKRDLETLELSDELREETKRYAKLNNVSIKEASGSSYISFLKEKEAAKARVEEASLGNKRVSQAKKDFSERSPKDFDRSTPDGRKEWDEYKAWLKTQ